RPAGRTRSPSARTGVAGGRGRPAGWTERGEGRRPARRPNPFRQGSGGTSPGADTHDGMDLARLTQRERGLDLVAVHLAALGADCEQAEVDERAEGEGPHEGDDARVDARRMEVHGRRS